MPDEEHSAETAAARAVLADWLAQRSLARDSRTADGLRQWNCTQLDEWLAFAPPAPGNRVYLVDGQTVHGYAPSQSSPAAALAAARAARDHRPGTGKSPGRGFGK